MALLDWKRVCVRSSCGENAHTTGLAGRILLSCPSFPVAEEDKEVVASMPESLDGSSWLVFHRETLYLVIRICKEKENQGCYIRDQAAKGCRRLVDGGVSCIFLSDGHMSQWVAEAVVLSTYHYDSLLSKKKTQVRILYKGKCKKMERTLVLAEAQNFARFLVDTPANLLTPELFVEYAKEYLPDQVDVKVYGKKELESMGMHLLLGVAQGSEQEPRLLELKYNMGKGTGQNESKNSTEKEPIALVGKGITFDSGGISLKPARKMAEMKGDMGGGAAVLAVLGAIARLGAEASVLCLVPLTENLPSGKATKPGDVHVGAAGKSVEVDNTDAEGRLVLADALHHALQYKPRKIIDIATLTGAIRVSLGTVMAGVFSNSEKLAREIVAAGEEAGDMAWHLPTSEEYVPFIKSDVADIKNVGGDAGGGSITAALFLREFVGGKDWAHIDIAGVSFQSHLKCLFGPGATGRPVKLLGQLLLSPEA